jgi:small subunit ribosomal protein S17
MPKRTLKGIVKSDKADKTIVVQVTRNKKHELYHKTLAFTKKFKAHDEENNAKEGDTVLIEESRPFSKHKTWILKQVVERAV